MNERIIPDSMQKSYDRFHFAPAVKVGEIVLCSGQIGTGADGRCPEDPAEQFALAFEHVETILKEAGGDLSSVVEMTSYHVDMSAHLGAFMKAKDAAMPEPHCAWTAIGCTELAMPGGLAEIRVTAHIA
ncbi:MAG: enamine deaminase RidA (YjgF/YER057c/UK114 family) [Candidatus Poriferisodalaceae bacterium]|jgi:enamine deaminase RidA (YjgF/YER057c/UK114 family)